MTKLTNTKIKWITRQKKRGMRVKDIAEAMGVSKRRIQQINKEFLLKGKMPELTKSRRPKTFISEEQKKVIDDAFQETKLSARLLYYELIKRGSKVPKNKLYNYMKEKSWVIPNPRLQKKRKRCRYERHHSGSLIHGDSHRTSIKHPYCILWIDDASRKILSGMESRTAITNDISIRSIKLAIKDAEKYNVFIFQVNTDRGPEFYCNKRGKRNSKSKFEVFLIKVGKQHLPSRINNPQTNGKLERLWREYDKHRWRFKTLKAWINWYNNRLHGALKLEWAEKPNEAFIRKRRPESILGEFLRLIENE